ncbi:MAG: hypothetical protein ACRETN_06510 [Nevskiales bacterium]
MQAIENRAVQAERFWRQGDAAKSIADLDAAYRAYTSAHDLITDCAKLHMRAHQKLREINCLRGSSERYTDNILLFLAPLGVFELLAFIFKSKVGSSELCRRTAN